MSGGLGSTQGGASPSAVLGASPGLCTPFPGWATSLVLIGLRGHVPIGRREIPHVLKSDALKRLELEARCDGVAWTLILVTVLGSHLGTIEQLALCTRP